MIVVLIFIHLCIAVTRLSPSRYASKARKRQTDDVDVPLSCPPGETSDLKNAHASSVVTRYWNEALLTMIRRDQARPTTHARNLYHSSLVFYHAFALFTSGKSRIGVKTAIEVFDEFPVCETESKDERDKAIDEAMSFAMYTLLRSRFRDAVNKQCVYDLLDQRFALRGYDVAKAQQLALEKHAVPECADGAAVLGVKVGLAMIKAAMSDGSCEADDYNCPGFYESKNPYPLNPYWNGPGAVQDPNHWQSLEIGEFIDQAGIAVGGYPPFTGPQWGRVTPFALREEDKMVTVDGKAMREPKDGVYFDVGPPPLWGEDSPSDDEYKGNFSVTLKVSGMLSPLDNKLIDTSPANSSIGANNLFARAKGNNLVPDEPYANVGRGHSINPSTGAPYQPNVVFRGDYFRVLAEFWADGPQSETPPGHWNTLLNAVMDHPEFERRWGGAGEVMDTVAYEVRAYLALNGVLHDSAIAAWGVKNYYDYVRPITAIRYMASLGQSSNKGEPGYHPGGLPLMKGHSFVVEESDICLDNCEDLMQGGFTPGAYSTLGFQAIGRVAVRAWESLSVMCVGVCWYMGQDWKTYQRPSFVTPPFAGYVSGHSTFSRAAADTISRFTGDTYFPGGMGVYVAEQDDFLVFEIGPSQTVELEWATYSDAADECSLSRVYGGIHPPCDDVPGRKLGRVVAARGWDKIVDIFGPTPTRVGVRIHFDEPVGALSRFNGDEGLMMRWAKELVGDIGGEGSVVRVLPRQPDEEDNQRTILVIGATNDQVEERVMDKFLAEQPFVERCEPLLCDALQCVSTQSEPVSTGTILLAVMGFVVFCGCLVTLCALTKKENDKHRLSEN